MTTTDRSVSDEILAAFDNVMDAGETLPISELKKRFKGDSYFRFRDHEIYKNLIDLPVRIEMITENKSTAVNKILDGLRELYGADLEFEFDSRAGGEAILHVRTWRDEKDLRAAWKGYAEETYKSEMHGQVA